MTSINSDYESAYFLCSFADGKIKLFDRRLSPEDAVVKTYRGHTSAVQKVRWQRSAARDVLSARYAQFPQHLEYILILKYK